MIGGLSVRVASMRTIPTLAADARTVKAGVRGL
jgi:hypothetical protein